ncbi:MAG: patatin-like phospholipase family protein [Saprospiraceae bacterium]
MQKSGLVLSGGGVRGVAHLGVIQVLKECGIKPAVVSGTSAGSLVGALYAAGHTLDTIFEFFKATAIFKISNFAARKPGIIDSDKFYAVLKEYLPEDDFGALKKQLFVTTTDIIHGRTRIFSEGPLIKTLLASSAVPVVFSPVEIEGTLYVDGGALNNFPVEPLVNNCDAIIGINVHPLKDTKPENIKSTWMVVERIFHLAINHHTLQKFHLCNIVIAPQKLASFGTFERGRFDEIYQVGYEAAQSRKGELLRLKAALEQQ